MISQSIRPLILLTATALGACRHAGTPVAKTAVTSTPHPASSVTMLVNPQAPETDTGVDVRTGSSILITAIPVADTAGRRFSDSSERLLPADADGIHGPFAILFSRFFRDRATTSSPADRLRVLSDRDGRRADFLTLMAHVGTTRGLTDHALESGSSVIGSARVWTAPATGRLHLFVNDWGPVDEAPPDRRLLRRPHDPLRNNTGALIATITDLGCRPIIVPTTVSH